MLLLSDSFFRQKQLFSLEKPSNCSSSSCRATYILQDLAENKTELVVTVSLTWSVLVFMAAGTFLSSPLVTFKFSWDETSRRTKKYTTDWSETKIIAKCEHSGSSATHDRDFKKVAAVQVFKKGRISSSVFLFLSWGKLRRVVLSRRCYNEKLKPKKATLKRC